MEYVEIAGKRFPCQQNGMTLVDSFYVPDANVARYREDREKCAELIAGVMQRHCAQVSRDFQRSEDGEAVVGRDSEGEILMLLHLDPDGVADVLKAAKFGQLENYVLAAASVD